MSEEKKDIIQYYTKLSAIRDGIDRIPKNGWNAFHKYKYAKEEDVLEYIRKALSDNKLFIASSLESQSAVNFDMDGGKFNLLTTVIMMYEITDIETGFSKEYRYAGYGSDKQDKGGYKAYTGGYKYFLMKMFQISTGDDPEKDTQKAKPTPKKPVNDEWITRLKEFEKSLPPEVIKHVKDLSDKERAVFYGANGKDVDKILEAVILEQENNAVPPIDGAIDEIFNGESK